MEIIYVCDSIMGSGKSMGAIKYMNDNKDKKFIYITPFLDEATRIRQNCPQLNFVEPKNTLDKFNFSKTEHTMYLIKQGNNISTTHKAFRMYTQNMLESIKLQEYILIVDEAVEVFDEAEYSIGDVEVLIEGGYIEYRDGKYISTGKEYTGTTLKELFGMLKCNNLVPVEESEKKKYLYYWMLPAEVLLAFKTVYVFTYLFLAQDLRYYLDIHNIKYSYIGIEKNNQNEYVFVSKLDRIPNHVKGFKDKIHIIENQKLNNIGRREHDLSVNWFKRSEGDNVKELKNNMYNFFRNYNKNVPTQYLMWSTYKKNIKAIQGKGYTKRFINFNEKATNKYKDNYVLSYCANVFARPAKVRYFEKHGFVYDEDLFALSTLVQWIWRSAIRDGHEIWLYIPSSRMRELLIKWLNEGG